MRGKSWTAVSLAIVAGCGGSSGAGIGSISTASTAESCMVCHNGSLRDDYRGGGLENPHPFGGAATLKCTTCHGGDPTGVGVAASHVPPPPEIGDENQQLSDRRAYFNRLTLAGIDKFPDYAVGGVTYSALDYLQFVNPGDLRVVTQGRSCGVCHAAHAECTAQSPLATEVGIISGALFAIGAANRVAASAGLYEDTAGDLAFRAVQDLDYVSQPGQIGAVGELLELPVFSVRNESGADDLFENPDYVASALAADRNADGTVVSRSKLENLFIEQVAFTCGDCHLGSAGANNRYGDFRSSGCTACHMRYSLDGRSRSSDPNIVQNEPRNPDAIDEPERAHVKAHRIVGVARTDASGQIVPGIDDYTCAGCHQGSNRTVMQYWGIRLDQNQDVRRGNQYPAQPATFRTTRDDARLFDPVVGNRTFNGRNFRQYLLEEDYDGDGRDDTPADVHYEAGLGCIDCHGSHDLHGGTPGDGVANRLYSRQDQAVAIRCESCHGSADTYAATTTGTTYDGVGAELAMDAEGNPLRHVRREGDGHFYLTSRLTGARHFVPQTRDVVIDSGVTNPLTGEPIYNARASYAMGRVDGDTATGIGPQQSGGVTAGFSHMDNLSCTACHSSWTNTCIGCHLGGEYDNGNNFSNITGERIVFRQEIADFVYQSPLFFQLGVDSHGKIAPLGPNTKMFFQYKDLNGDRSQVFTFSDRNGRGANGSATPFPSLGHNAMMPHSIRGRVTSDAEGPRYCVGCHLTSQALATYGVEYDAFRTAMAAGDWGALDFPLLAQHFGQNTGNQLDSPLWVHMVAGLGTGLFLFDASGAPENPLDDNEDRIGAGGLAPSTTFDPLGVSFNLDAIADATGAATGSNNHPLLGEATPLRDGAANLRLAGPLGATIIDALTNPTTGIVLDSWLDADGTSQGGAAGYLSQ